MRTEGVCYSSILFFKFLWHYMLAITSCAVTIIFNDLAAVNSIRTPNVLKAKDKKPP